MKLYAQFLKDFYKLGHPDQYPNDTEQVVANATARATRLKDQKYVNVLGVTYLIKEYLQDVFDETFFNRSFAEVVIQYRDVMANCLGIKDADDSRIAYLHKLGYLPIDIWALPEGSKAGINCPYLVLTNTDDKCFWLVNALETLISAVLWGPITSSTKARRMRDIMEQYAKEFYGPDADLSFIDWQGHDFSMRGMFGIEAGILSGLGHLSVFKGTDTIPAILAARDYYGANLTCGGSVPATEHSVMCAYGDENEFETFRHLIEDVYPEGIVSIVSDTWDLWKVCTDFIPRLKDKILARKGKIVIRPDSGDPVKIVCGDNDAPDGSPAHLGVLWLLRDALGETDGMINGAGVIYGDSIDEDRCERILQGCLAMGFSPYNVVFGIGSYTYQYVTRDTHYQAIKATAVRRNGKWIDIFKNPVTDDGNKKSCKGIPCVYKSEFGPIYDTMTDGNDISQLDKCGFVKYFSNGNLLVNDTWDEIRARIKE